MLAVTPLLLVTLYAIAESRFVVDGTPLTELVRLEPLVVSVLLVTIVPVPILPPTLDVMTFPEDESVFEVLRVVMFAVAIFAVLIVAAELVRLVKFPVPVALHVYMIVVVLEVVLGEL